MLSCLRNVGRTLYEGKRGLGNIGKHWTTPSGMLPVQHHHYKSKFHLVCGQQNHIDLRPTSLRWRWSPTRRHRFQRRYRRHSCRSCCMFPHRLESCLQSRTFRPPTSDRWRSSPTRRHRFQCRYRRHSYRLCCTIPRRFETGWESRTFLLQSIQNEQEFHHQCQCTCPKYILNFWSSPLLQE